MLAPMLVQMERQIDREIAADNKANGVPFGTQTDDDSNNSISIGTENIFDTDSDDEDEGNEPVLVYGPQPQIITNDLKSLDEMVSVFLTMRIYQSLKVRAVLEYRVSGKNMKDIHSLDDIVYEFVFDGHNDF